LNETFQRGFHTGPYGSSNYPVNGPGWASCNTYVYYTCPILPNATSYNWAWPQDWTYVSGQGTNQLELYTGSFGGNVGVGVDNDCGGSGSYSQIYVYVDGWCPQWFQYSPNPTDDELAVSVDESVAITQNIDTYEVTLTNERQEKSFSNLSAKGRTVIPTKQLKNGRYVLKVRHKEHLERYHIVIQH
jgi:hypothetical protein